MYHVIQSSVIFKGGVFEDTMFYVLAWKRASPRKCPVFGSRTALFFDLLKICQGHEHCWSTPENLRIFERRFFFLWRSPEFCENLRLFEPRPFARTFRVMSLVPRHGEGLSSRSVSLTSDFFCVLDSTSGALLQKLRRRVNKPLLHFYVFAENYQKK